MMAFTRLPPDVISILARRDVKFNTDDGSITDDPISINIQWIIPDKSEPLFYENGTYAGYLNMHRIVIVDKPPKTVDEYVSFALG